MPERRHFVTRYTRVYQHVYPSIETAVAKRSCAHSTSAATARVPRSGVELLSTPSEGRSKHATSQRPSLRVGVDAGWRDEDRCSSLFSHHTVVGVPVVVGSSGCGEDLAEQDPQSLCVDVWIRVVRSDHLGAAFDGDPLPTR